VRWVCGVLLGMLGAGLAFPVAAQAVNPAPTSVTLTASAAVISSTSSASLVATPNRPLYAGEYRVGIYDVTGATPVRVGGCTSAPTCTVGVDAARLRDGTGAPQTHRFLARVEADNATGRVVATSAVKSVAPVPWAVTWLSQDHR
jgi:hypothetical protein